MPSNYIILSHSLHFLFSIFPSISIFSNELVLYIRWPKYWSFSISPSNEYSWFISFRIDWFNLHIVQFSSVLSLSRVWLFPTARQGSLSFTNSQSLLKPISTESVMKSNISSSVIPFFSHLQSFPASGSFQMSQFFASGGQSTGVSASKSVFPMNIHDWSPCSSRDSQESSPNHRSNASIMWCSAFFIVQRSHPYMTTGKKNSLDYTDLCWQSNIPAF